MTFCCRPMTSSAGSCRSQAAADLAFCSGSELSLVCGVRNPNIDLAGAADLPCVGRRSWRSCPARVIVLIETPANALSVECGGTLTYSPKDSPAQKLEMHSC